MSFGRSLFTVSGLTILSRIAGFVRDSLIAAVVGTGPIADAFFVAQRLPNLFRSLFAEGAFSSAFVPLYTATHEKDGDKAAAAFAGQALAILLTALLPFCALVICFMPTIMTILAPGFSKDPARFDLAVSFASITFPYLVFISIGALQTGVLNAHGRFAAGAAAPIGYNLIMIIMIFGAKACHLDIGLSLAWGVTLAGLAQLLWLAIDARRSHISIPLMFPHFGDASRQLLRRLGPGAIGAGAAQINLLISTVLASTLPMGAVSYLFYADRLNQLPLGIVGIAVGTTLLPILARSVQAGRDNETTHTTSRAIEFCALLGLPAAFGLAMVAAPIVQVLFERGAFSHADTLATAQTLMAYALGIPAFLFVKVFASLFFARQDTSTPVRVALLTMGINVAASLLLIHPLHHVGIALANSIAVTANAVILFIILRRKGWALADHLLKRRLRLIILSALTMAGVSGLLVKETASLFTETFGHAVLGLGLILGGSGSLYILMLILTRAVIGKDLLALLRRTKHNNDLKTDSTPSDKGE